MKLCPPWDNSTPTRFYDVLKFHKAIIPFKPIVSACVTSTNKLAKLLSRLLQLHCGNNFSLVKDNKGLSKSLKEQKVAPEEQLVSFDVSALFTSIPVSVFLEVINRKFTQHINK